jgi:hypothetical protein
VARDVQWLTGLEYPSDVTDESAMSQPSPTVAHLFRPSLLAWRAKYLAAKAAKADAPTPAKPSLPRAKSPPPPTSPQK